MNPIVEALTAAGRSLFSGRMMGLVFWPLLGASVFWGVVAWLGWGHWLGMFQHVFGAVTDQQRASLHALAWLGGALAFVLLGVGSLLLILVTALVITSIVAMPKMVDEIARRHYPELQRRNGGTASGSVINATWVLLVYLVLLLLSLPLWFLVPFGGVLLPLLLNGWLNARLFRYDALAEHASREEYRQLMRVDGRSLLLMGIILAVIQLVPSFTILLLPLVILLMPVYTGLTFIHYALARLQALRAGLDTPNTLAISR